MRERDDGRRVCDESLIEMMDQRVCVKRGRKMRACAETVGEK